MAFQQQEPSASTGFCRSLPEPQTTGVRLKLDPNVPWKPPPKRASDSPPKQH